MSFYGSYVNGNLNVEKMIIHSIARTYKMENPVCDKCGTRTISKGQHDFRCPKCGARYQSREFVEIKRDVSPGRYDVPVIARRHLSMPFEIEGFFAVQSMLQQNKG
mgnify:CR=1 FL=1